MNVELTHMQTDRLSMDPYSTCVNEVHRLMSDPEVSRFTIWDCNTIENTMEYLDKHKGKLFVIRELNTGRFIGTCILRVSDLLGAPNSIVSIGYYIVPDAWNKGYATEVSRKLIQYAFDELKVHKVVATCDPENYHSSKVLQKSGMTFEGINRQDVLNHRGQWKDRAHYSILVSEYRIIKGIQHYY